MTDPHRALAVELITKTYASPQADDEMLPTISQFAAAHALLAIEARLAEQVQQQRIANVLEALHAERQGAIELPDEARDWLEDALAAIVQPAKAATPHE